MFIKRLNKVLKPVEQPKEEIVEQIEEVKLNKKVDIPKKKIIKNDSKIKMNITKPSKKVKKTEIKLDTNNSDSSDY